LCQQRVELRVIDWNTAWLQDFNKRQKYVVVYAVIYALYSLRPLLVWPVARRALQFALHPAVHSNLIALQGVRCTMLKRYRLKLLNRVICKRSCCNRPACIHRASWLLPTACCRGLVTTAYLGYTETTVVSASHCLPCALADPKQAVARQQQTAVA
jgi:hypothetical protein